MATGDNVWSAQTLPQGWDAKYDAVQRRFYFINHQMQTTTWDDPRKTAWEQAVNQKNSNQQQKFGHSSGPTHDGPSVGSTPHKSPDKMHLKEFVPTSYNGWEKHVEDKYGLKIQHIKDDVEETSFSDEASPVLDHNALAKLKHSYPSVDAEVIKDVLRGVNNELTKAKHQLNALGFSPTHTPPRHDDSSPQRSFLNQAQHKAKSHKSPAPPPPTGPTETQKANLKQKLTKEFPHCAAQVVVMALDASQYDESKTRILLKTAAGGGNRDSSRKSSPSKGCSKESPHLGQTIPVYATVKKHNTVNNETSPAKTITQRSHLESGSNLSSLIDSASSRKEQISKKSTTGRKKATKAPLLKTQPQAGEYRSKYRTQPVGANIDMWKGPNLDIILYVYFWKYTGDIGYTFLLFTDKCVISTRNVAKKTNTFRTDYMPIHGPDPKNYQGSQQKSVSNYQPVAKGPDRALAKGPNPSLVRGPSVCVDHVWTTERQSPVVCGGLINVLCPPTITSV
ncbi:hypothetical protein LSH36_891g02018 [Paralvinella palmiformis]|uniref:WW domain-containing protein n=1 Tax=Paralvinella palmiformis TaxID=53620 RepID=A0AAD9IZH7_9ANNE|nr:hypothetical protein LSH36_891g02018 [Paralvinella palmiformis]